MPQDDANEQAQKQAQLRDLLRRHLDLAGISLTDEEQQGLLTNFEQLMDAINGLNSLDLASYEPAVILPRERIG